MNVGATADQSSVTRAAVRFDAARRGNFFRISFLFISTMFVLHLTLSPRPNYKLPTRIILRGKKVVFQIRQLRVSTCTLFCRRGFFSGMLRKNVIFA